MTVEALAERYLGHPAPELREAGLYSSTMAYPNTDPTSIVFAEAPRFSGFTGICEARTVTIQFRPPKDAATATTALIPQPAEEGHRFRVIERVPGGKALAGDIARQARACAEGPVLPAGEWDNDGRFFWGSDLSAATLNQFVLALRTAQDDAHRHRHVPECEADVMLGEDPMCADPAKALASVDWLRIIGVSFWEQDNLSHATFYFKRYPDDARAAAMVQVEIGAYVFEGQEDVQIESVRILGVTRVD